MENALLIGLSRQVSLKRKMDVIANNMANMHTTGYKRDRITFEEYLMPTARMTKMSGNDRLLSFVHEQGQIKNLSDGVFNQTGNELDIAIKGAAYLTMQTPNGPGYSKDGALKIGADGILQNTDGYPVLGTGGPISFGPNEQSITIARDGTISTSEGVKGKLALVSFENSQNLRKKGHNIFTSEQAPIPNEKATIHQGFLEQSNVKPVMELTHMIEVQRAYTQTAKLIEQLGTLKAKSINKLGEIPR